MWHLPDPFRNFLEKTIHDQEKHFQMPHEMGPEQVTEPADLLRDNKVVSFPSVAQKSHGQRQREGEVMDTDKAMPDEIWFKPYGGVHLENPECGYSKYIRHDLALPTEAALVEALEVARVCLISSMHTELMVGKGIIRKQGFTVGSEVIDRAYAEQFFNDSATGKIINEALKAQKGGA